MNAEKGGGEGEKEGRNVSGTTGGEGDERRYHRAPPTARRTEREGRRREAQQDRPAVRHVGQRLGKIDDRRRQVQAHAVRGARVSAVRVRGGLARGDGGGGGRRSAMSFIGCRRSVVVFLRDSAITQDGVLLTASNNYSTYVVSYRIVYLEHAKACPAEFFLSIGFLRKPTKNTHVARVPQNKIK